jgi:hypothetical protein
MAANGSIVGVTLAKVNGIYLVNVKNATWDFRRPTVQEPTGGGIDIATGLVMPSGSFDEVVPLADVNPQFNWLALTRWSVQVYDQATRTQLIFSAQGCEWEDLGGSSNTAGAQTARKISWKGRVGVYI